uniref:(northern house mosquito) hypothetical protein n=1 Tax=Culex pipiens TaxID=7175 RepID=A0A8D8CZX5_CULPI
MQLKIEQGEVRLRCSTTRCRLIGGLEFASVRSWSTSHHHHHQQQLREVSSNNKNFARICQTRSTRSVVCCCGQSASAQFGKLVVMDWRNGSSPSISGRCRANTRSPLRCRVQQRRRGSAHRSSERRVYDGPRSTQGSVVRCFQRLSRLELQQQQHPRDPLLAERMCTCTGATWIFTRKMHDVGRPYHLN